MWLHLLLPFKYHSYHNLRVPPTLGPFVPLHSGVLPQGRGINTSLLEEGVSPLLLYQGWGMRKVLSWKSEFISLSKHCYTPWFSFVCLYHFKDQIGF